MITVITTALPGRGFLAECVASIEAQTLQPSAHLIGVDYDRIGCGVMRNRLLESVQTEYVCVLDDDDIAHPEHLATMAEAMLPATDIVWTDSHHDGPNPIPRIHYGVLPLKQGNFIPPTALMRTEMVRKVGGWREDIVCADWGLYVALEDAGAVFQRIPVTTWTYRWHGANQSASLTEADLHL